MWQCSLLNLQLGLLKSLAYCRVSHTWSVCNMTEGVLDLWKKSLNHSSPSLPFHCWELRHDNCVLNIQIMHQDGETLLLNKCMWIILNADSVYWEIIRARIMTVNVLRFHCSHPVSVSAPTTIPYGFLSFSSNITESSFPIYLEATKEKVRKFVLMLN